MAARSIRRSFATSVILASVLPSAAFMATIAIIVPRHQVEHVESSVDMIASSVALEVERYIETPRRQLLGLEAYMTAARDQKAGTRLPETGGDRAIIDLALDAMAFGNPDFADVLVLDSSGILTAASSSMRGRIGEDLSGEPGFAEAMESGGIVLSDPFISPAAAGVTIGAFKRVGDLAIAAHIKLESLSGLLVPLLISPKDRIAVVDRWGFAIAHTDLSYVREQRRVEIPGKGIEAVSDGGGSWLATSRVVPEVGWFMVYYRDRREAMALAYQLNACLFAIAAVSLALSAALFLRLMAAFSRPFDDLVERLRNIAAGRYDERIEGNYAQEFQRIAEAFNTMADNVRDRDRLISRDLEEKTILLREVHHRVKNNLQIMSSLLHLEERYIRDPADAELLRSSQSRIFSMSLTHEILYQSESLSGIRVSDYAKSLVGFLCGAFSIGALRVETDFDEVSLSLEQALPFGLVLNELATNALKYAVKDVPNPFLGISIKRDRECCVLEVRDRGPGLPPREEGHRRGTLGYSLMRSLTAQLEGEIHIESAFPGEEWPGVRAQLRFPIIEETRISQKTDHIE